MKLSRRGFIAGVSAGALAAGTARAGAHKRFRGYPGRMGLLHDTTLCVGCRSCEFACTEVNDLPPPTQPVGDTRVFEKTRGPSDKLYTVVNRYGGGAGGSPVVFRKHQCMHCNEPCCASVCFVKAFTKTPEGPVLYDPSVCVGCRYCVFACPYYALAYEYGNPATPRVVRCTMCYPRIIKGQVPACAEACPTGAIQYGPREKLILVARERMRKWPDKYYPELFGENEYGGTSWLTLLARPPEQLGLPADLPYDPLPNLTTNFLSMAPLVAAIFPGMLGGFHAFAKRKQKVAEEKMRQHEAELKRRHEQEIEKLERRYRSQLEALGEQARKEYERRLQAEQKAAAAGGGKEQQP